MGNNNFCLFIVNCLLTKSVSHTDEIMQQESSPLCAADISPDLRKQFAFLSGESPTQSILECFATKDCVLTTRDSESFIKMIIIK